MFNPETTAEEVINGNRAALAKALTAAENEYKGADKMMHIIEKAAGKAFIIGITGPPGAGKSTFTGCLASFLREKGLKIGIIAVDPSSPFSGGAILGDRIRMRSHNSDDNVFIRSMGSRGALGGLSLKTSNAAKLMDAFGMDFVIIETVGVGQSEVEIASASDLVTVVLAPGFGDEIQALKAGILEIADIFAVNKSDLPGADKLAAELSAEAESCSIFQDAIPSIVKCSSRNREGFTDFLKELESRIKSLEASGGMSKRRAKRKEKELSEIIKDAIRLRTERIISGFGGLLKILEDSGDSVFEAAKKITDSF